MAVQLMFLSFSERKPFMANDIVAMQMESCKDKDVTERSGHNSEVRSQFRKI